MMNPLKAALDAVLHAFRKLDALMEELCWLRYGFMPLLGGIVGIAIGLALGAFVVVPLLEGTLH